MRRLSTLAGVAVAAIALLAAGCTEGTPKKTGESGDAKGGAVQGRTLDAVKKRGVLNCGVNNTVPGFGFVTESGEYEGFDIDYCKAVAAAVLGDPKKVKYKPLTTETRFTGLKSRDVDVLIRNTTWTSSRDGGEGATFLSTTFYDGGSMMVKAKNGWKTLADMPNNADICVLGGTTNEQTLTAAFKKVGKKAQAHPFEDNEKIQPAFENDRCVGWFSDASQLAGVRAKWPKGAGGPEALTIFKETYSKEPLGPVVRDGDSQWAQIVDWVVISTVAAEELGITQANVDQMDSSKNADIQLWLGKGEEDKAFDPQLGLDVDFAVKVIKAVGNYGEIFERNLGPKTPLGLERGVNALWTKGGLHYAPPYR